MLFWTLFAIDCAAAAVAVFFFLTGLADGSVSSFNAGLWFMLLGGIAAILGGGLWLRGAGRLHLARGLLALLAVPAIGAAVLILTLIVAQPRWN